MILVSCSYVGDGPASFLLDALLVIVGQKSQQTRKGLVVDDELKGDDRCRRNISTRYVSDIQFAVMHSCRFH